MVQTKKSGIEEQIEGFAEAIFIFEGIDASCERRFKRCLVQVLAAAGWDALQIYKSLESIVVVRGGFFRVIRYASPVASQRWQPKLQIIFGSDLCAESDAYLRWALAHELGHVINGYWRLDFKVARKIESWDQAICNFLAEIWGFPCPKKSKKGDRRMISKEQESFKRVMAQAKNFREMMSQRALHTEPELKEAIAQAERLMEQLKSARARLLSEGFGL